MNPHKAYQAQCSTPGLSRIDTLLGLYDAAIDALAKAMPILGTNDATAAAPLLGRARLALSGLAGGVDPSYGELSRNMMRLYEFVIHSLAQGTTASVASALSVLETLREGLQQIRPDALALERGGAIPPVGSVPQFQASA